MTDQEIDKIAEKVKAGIKGTIDSEIKPFYVGREVHFLQHKFIESLMGWMDKTQSIILKTVVTVIVAGILGLVVLGFILWGRGKFN
jgi:hypothetical protein